MENKILATHANASPEGWECLVAFRSAPGQFKANYSYLDKYPTWEDVLATVANGTKLSKPAAGITFAELSSSSKYDY